MAPVGQNLMQVAHESHLSGSTFIFHTQFAMWYFDIFKMIFHLVIFNMRIAFNYMNAANWARLGTYFTFNTVVKYFAGLTNLESSIAFTGHSSTHKLQRTHSGDMVMRFILQGAVLNFSFKSFLIIFQVPGFESHFPLQHIFSSFECNVHYNTIYLLMSKCEY